MEPLQAPADENLHDPIAERYYQAATFASRNLDFREWAPAIKANWRARILDRVHRNAHCLPFDGQSQPGAKSS